jgi:DNA-binding NarL/FixJ family response regulator
MSERPLQLMLVDDDPTFRLGLRIWLEQIPGFQVVGEASTAPETLQKLKTLTPRLDLVILDIGLGQGDATAIPGLQLCQTLKTDFPGLRVLVLSAQAEPVLEAAAKQMGADGYGFRGMPVRELADLIRRLTKGTRPTTSSPSRLSEAKASPIPGPITALRLSMRLSGLQHIDQALTQLQAQSQSRPSDTFSWLTQEIRKGQQRELKAARWLISTLWATPNFKDTTWATSSQWRTNSLSTRPQPQNSTQTAPGAILPIGSSQSSLLPTNTLPPNTIQSLVFETVFIRLQINLENISEIPLETDILRLEKKQELFYITLRKLDDLLNELRQSPIRPSQLPEKAPQILSDLWDAVVEDFFGKYYTVKVNAVEQTVISVIQREKAAVQTEILNAIPLVDQLLSHWLFQSPFVVEGDSYPAQSPEALRQSEKLLENLLVQVANAVIQPLLNRMADVEEIKKNLFNRHLITTREIERFRNDLSWHYRWNRLINNPKAIFESQYRLFCFTPRGIELTSIYAARREELEQLTGAQWAMTMALETRDAIAPRLRSVLALVGSGLVYVLTEVVGRGIGLIGRGVLQGVGNAWQDTRRSKKRSEPFKGFNEWE